MLIDRSFYFKLFSENDIALQALSHFKIDKEALKEKAKNRFVLLAEDEKINHTVIKTYLKSYGYTVVDVWNGQDAIEAFTSQDFDLVLLDLGMKPIDGFEAAQCIKQIQVVKKINVPIIAQTATWEIDPDYLKQFGFDGVISKPLHPEFTEVFLAYAQAVIS